MNSDRTLVAQERSLWREVEQETRPWSMAVMKPPLMLSITELLPNDRPTINSLHNFAEAENFS